MNFLGLLVFIRERTIFGKVDTVTEVQILGSPVDFLLFFVTTFFSLKSPEMAMRNMISRLIEMTNMDAENSRINFRYTNVLKDINRKPKKTAESKSESLFIYG